VPEVTASQLMSGFASRTGLVSGARPLGRYLWTDAFAVCNFLGLYLEKGDAEALSLARRLVEQTHQVLGRHRADDPRSGWISGLAEREGARHPTQGGLRIGKSLPERGPDEREDPDLEWERDGQYFHYLTKWMWALERMAEVTGEPDYHRWAFELARTAHEHFTRRSAQGQVEGLYWKMSIDLSRPQVRSMGHHDPLDGYLTYLQIQGNCGEPPKFDLGAEVRAMAQLCAGRHWETADALGIGGLLCDALRLAGLSLRGVVAAPGLLSELLTAALRGIGALLRQRTLEAPAELRLAFREFGLSLGLRAARRLRELASHGPQGGLPGLASLEPLHVLARFEPLADEIERFWCDPSHRESPSWREHREINAVMLATSLAPAGFLGDPGLRARASRG